MVKTVIMNKIRLLISVILIITISSCSKKTQPSSTTSTTTKSAETKTVKPKTIKTAVPKVITVNDKYAKRSIDGRYYYDLEGRRYWRNNKDGKYYLFNKSMYDDPDFKAKDN